MKKVLSSDTGLISREFCSYKVKSHSALYIVSWVQNEGITCVYRIYGLARMTAIWAMCGTFPLFLMSFMWHLWCLNVFHYDQHISLPNVIDYKLPQRSVLSNKVWIMINSFYYGGSSGFPYSKWCLHRRRMSRRAKGTGCQSTFGFSSHKIRARLPVVV